MDEENGKEAAQATQGTEAGKSYTRAHLERYAQQNGLSTEFAGRDLYDEGKPSQFLTLDDGEGGWEEYVWIGSGNGKAEGAIYKRMA